MAIAQTMGLTARLERRDEDLAAGALAGNNIGASVSMVGGTPSGPVA